VLIRESVCKILITYKTSPSWYFETFQSGKKKRSITW